MDWYPRKTQLYRNKTWHLSLAEHGAYTLLIDYYYTSESPLPNNDNALASIIGCSLDDWLAVRDNVTRYFSVSNGMLTHETCDEVLEDQLSKRKDGASRVAKYRARKNKNNVTRDTSVSNAPRGEERKGEERKEGTNVPKKNDDLVVMDSFDYFWELYPRQRRGNKEKARRAYMRALSEFRATEDDILEGVKAYAGSQEVADKRAKGCEGWLNDDRWEVDYAPPTNQGNNGQGGEIKAALNKAADDLRRRSE